MLYRAGFLSKLLLPDSVNQSDVHVGPFFVKRKEGCLGECPPLIDCYKKHPGFVISVCPRPIRLNILTIFMSSKHITCY